MIINGNSSLDSMQMIWVHFTEIPAVYAFIFFPVLNVESYFLKDNLKNVDGVNLHLEKQENEKS